MDKTAYSTILKDGQNDTNTNFMPLFADLDTNPELQINYNADPKEIDDKLDHQLRSDFEYGVVENDTTMFPSLSKEPIFLKTIPVVSIYGNQVPNGETDNIVPLTQNARTKSMTKKANQEINLSVSRDYTQMGIAEIVKKVATNLLNLLNDLLDKPVDSSWSDFLSDVFTKDDRIFSIGILFIFTSVFIIFFSTSTA